VPEVDLLNSEKVWRLLEEVKDPEIPVVSMVEMGMIRSVGVTGEGIHIVISPTFAGCPALRVMESQIEECLIQAGADKVEVKRTFSPPWTSDWITPAGRLKLKSIGLAPPPAHAGRIETALLEPVACPYCDSTETRLTNDFGPTLCRAIFVCDNCRQPFERFKPI
jgi:ring-1,2-phenylacetyl-CoA epoxidase subunit PaaD